MEAFRIISTENTLFDEAWRIYNDNFPHVERRTLHHQKTALKDDRYHFDIFTKNDTPIGIACYWIFEGYLYVEHLAIDKSTQGGGYGTKLLDFFKQKSPGVVILEIEPIVDEITARRLSFYERFGFHKNDYLHLLPQYHETSPTDMEMILMTYPYKIDKALFDTFVKELHEVVMKVDD